MKRKMIYGLLVLALLSLSLISAKSVERWVNNVDDHYIMPANSDENPCDFDIDWNFHGSEFYIVWFNEEGNVTRVHGVANNIDEAFSANGKSLKLQGVTIQYRLSPDGKLIETYLGVSGFGQIPGYGPVWGGAGNCTTIYEWDPEIENWVWVETIRDVGKREYDDFYLICEYLSP